nr:PREDICTED: uncharacterized protein LOC100875866 [Megachile rotundata]
MKMENDRNERIVHDFIPQQRMLSILGIWPTDINDFASIVRFTFAIAIDISYIYSLAVELFRRCVSVDEVMDAFIMLVVCSTSMSKLLINRMNWKHMHVLINAVVKDRSIVRDSRHERLIIKYFRKGRAVFLVLLYMCYVSAPSLIVKTNSFDEVLKQQLAKHLMDSPESWNATSTNNMSVVTCIYGIVPLYLRIGIVVLQAMQVTIVTMIHCSNDGWFFSLTMHLCSQFEVLQMDLEEIEFEKRDCLKKFSLLVKRHCYLVRLANNLKQSFSTTILLQLLTSTLMICVEGFVFLVNLSTGDSMGTLKSVLLILTMIIQLYLYAYAGDMLESRAEGVANAVYKSSWYLVRGNAARGLTLMIHRGHLSCHVTAGKFAPMNRLTFKEAMKASASYLSVLRVMMKMFLVLQKHLTRMKIPKNTDLAYAMSPLEIVAWPLGTWPLREENATAIANSAITLFILIVMLLITYVELYLDMSNTEKDMNALMLITCGLLAVSKIICYRFRAPGLIFNFNSAVKDYANLNSEEYRKIMRRHARMGRVACVTVITFSYSSSLLLGVQAAIAGDPERVEGNFTIPRTREYPVPSDRLITILEIPDSLFVFLSFTYEACFFMFASSTGSDSLFFAISFHLCGQVEILKAEFTRLITEKKNSMEEFYTCIKRHIYLLELGDMLNNTISSILLVQIFSSSVLITITGFQLIYAVAVKDLTIGMKSIVIVCNFSLQLFTYSYVGDYIKSQMDEIGFSLYSCKWENFPKVVAKDLMFVIMRAQRSFHLVAGKHFMVNIETYASILKASMSYLSVLRVMLIT